MEKPFVTLFHTPNSAYFWETNKNEFVDISETSFQYLSEVLSGNKVYDVNEPEELRNLKEQGYLSTTSNVKEVRHPYSQYLDVFLDRKLSKVTLQVTQDCNFRCKYCIYSEKNNLGQRSHSRKKMSWEIAKKAVDFLWAHSVDSKRVNVAFYGGEPLLEFSLIKRVVSYCNDLFFGKRLSYSITTNGTLLSDEIISFLFEHNISLTISLDGPKEINDQNRVFINDGGTYDKVMERIHRIAEEFPQYYDKLAISMVMDPSNDFDCINGICLEGSALDKLNIQSTLVDTAYSDETNTISEDYVWKYEYQAFLALLSFWGRYKEDDVSPIAIQSVKRTIYEYRILQYVSGLTTIDAPGGPCIPGQMRLFVDVDGRLFPCERVSETSPSMIIGDLENGFDLLNASKILNIGNLTESDCIKCWCFRHCGMCAKKADNSTAELSPQVKLASCDEMKNKAYYTIRIFLLLAEASTYYNEQLGRENKLRSVEI